MTCLAWANCIGDYMSITTFAKRGRASTAVSGIFSGQLFNFSIGFGSSLLLQSSSGEYEFDIFSFNGSTF
jgi:Ca2+/Na+ antiporter